MEQIAEQSKASQLVGKLTAAAQSVLEKLPELSVRKIILVSIPLAIAIVAGIICMNLKHVTITRAGESVKATTFCTDPTKILSDNNIKTSKYDKVIFSGINNNYGTIRILPAFKVSVKADGKVLSLMTPDGNVEDVLKKLDVTMNDEDIISASLDSKVTADQTITIQRVTYNERTTYSDVPFTTEKEETASMRRGTTKVIQEGKNGKLATISKVKFIDGVEQSGVTVSEKQTEAPVTKKILVGTASATPYSTLSVPSSLKLDGNGKPLNYKKCFTGKATAYSAKQGTLTASGRSTMVGHVAVDPSKIPYGSKLYIMSPNGNFVYGYAIAADTGTFTSNGSGVLTDLFFASNSQCRSFGEKTVSVYVLN